MSEERLDAIIKRAIEKAKDDWIHAHETGMADNLHINDPPLRDIDRDHGSRASVSSGSAAPRPSRPEQLLTNSGSSSLQTTTKVPEGMYLKITQVSIDLAKGLSISCDDKNPREKMHQLLMAMQASNLLSLIDGTRLEPVCSALNTTGYSQSSVKQIEINGVKRNEVILQDDCYRYYSEKK